MSDPNRNIEFVQLLTRHQRQLHRFIAVFLPRAADAEDVLQETNTVLWTKADQFAWGTSFFAWAKAVARYEIIEFCRRKGYERSLFDSDLLETLSAEIVESGIESAREDAMRACLAKLTASDRQLIEERYSQGQMAQVMAELHKRPVNSIYRSLERIRMALLECINRTLAAEVREQ